MTNVEYILDFINSDRVYKHLIDIGYEPDSLTAACIVYSSREHTLGQKEKGYSFIIENLPDMKIPTEYNAGQQSVHGLLREYISTLSRYIEAFESESPDAVYDFSTNYGDGWVDDENLYSSYATVIDAAEHSFPNNFAFYPEAKKPLFFRIRRREIDFEDGSECLYLTPGFEPHKFTIDTIMPDEDCELLHLFERLAKERNT